MINTHSNNHIHCKYDPNAILIYNTKIAIVFLLLRQSLLYICNRLQHNEKSREIRSDLLQLGVCFIITYWRNVVLTVILQYYHQIRTRWILTVTRSSAIADKPPDACQRRIHNTAYRPTTSSHSIWCSQWGGFFRAIGFIFGVGKLERLGYNLVKVAWRSTLSIGHNTSTWQTDTQTATSP